MDNPLEKGTVGKNGNTLLTNYAWLDITFDGFKISNIPLKESEYNDLIKNKGKDHAMHMSGYNCYIKSFSCERAIPNAVKNFWTNAGGGLNCNVTVFDPTFIQFENMIMQSVKNQKVHCVVSYGISMTGGLVPKPFEAHCIVKQMSESITAAGVEWSLELSTVPPEYFDTYPTEGKNEKKETVINMGKGTKYERVSDLVAKLIEDEGWNGIVIETEKLKKKYKIPTKDFASKIDLVMFKLAPMAKCSDNQKKDIYHTMIGMDNTVYFMPSGMTIKQARESKIAKKIGALKDQDDVEYAVAEQSTIEQLNMQDYIANEDGILVFKYGFQNSIVQSLDINYDCMSMITQFVYSFVFLGEDGKFNEKNSKTTFNIPDIEIPKKAKEKGIKVYPRKIFLYENNKEDALEAARTIVRKLQVVGYKGSAKLLNWPYITPCQTIRFEYLIPNGSAMVLKQTNDVGKDKQAGSFNNNAEAARNTNTVEEFARQADKNKTDPNRADNSNAIKNTEDYTKLLVESKDREDKVKSLRAKGLKGNKANSDIAKDADFRSNVGIPTGLTSWSDTHKQSTLYYISSITDTIEGWLMTTEVQLTGLFSEDFPQLNK